MNKHKPTKVRGDVYWIAKEKEQKLEMIQQSLVHGLPADDTVIMRELSVE